MKYLIIYAHPNPKSFCHAIKEEIEKTFINRKNDFVIRDLYDMNFSPTLSARDFEKFASNDASADIKKEQELINQAENLVFVYPVWWFSMPAILKGYIDRVFSRGFAYDFSGKKIKGLLTEKKVFILSTTGGPRFAYILMGYLKAIATTIDTGIFKFCGMKKVFHKYFYEVPSVSDLERKKMLESIKKLDF